MILEIALGIVLAFLFPGVAIPLILSLAVAVVSIIALSAYKLSPAADALGNGLRRHPMIALLVLSVASLLGAFAFVNQDWLW